MRFDDSGETYLVGVLERVGSVGKVAAAASANHNGFNRIRHPYSSTHFRGLLFAEKEKHVGACFVNAQVLVNSL